MDADVLTPPLLGQRVDAAQVVSRQRRMIKIATVLVGPFKTVLAQHFGKAIKKYCVVGADGVVGDREFECHRDERQCNDAGRAQIAIGVHPESSSSFSALVVAGSEGGSLPPVQRRKRNVFVTVNCTGSWQRNWPRSISVRSQKYSDVFQPRF